MKRERLFSAVRLALSLLLVIGIKSFLHACVHEDGSFGTCHWAGEAIFGVGVVLAALSALSLLLSGDRAGLGVAAATMPAALLGFMLPGGLIPLCMMETMHCNAVMKPGVRLICAAVFILSGISFLTGVRRGKKV